MSPRQEPARPIKKIKLKITLEADGPTLTRTSRIVKGSKIEGGALVIKSQTSDPARAIEEIALVGKAARNGPKELK